MRFTISGSIRSKKNSKQIIKVGNRHIPISSKAYKAWEKEAHKELSIQSRGFGVRIVPVHITATFYYKGSRPDIHGAMESLADCLQGYVIADDRQIESWDGTRIIHDKENPRTEFEILKFTE